MASVVQVLAWMLPAVLLLESSATARVSPESTWDPADSGARIVAVDELTPRARDLTIDSPAVGVVLVRLLVPQGLAQGSEDEYATLYLLHGGAGGYADWSQETTVEDMTASTELLVAMPAAASSYLGAWLPDGGPEGRGGSPNWETFHIEELPQLLERNFGASDARAIAGLSLGGWGALMSAARHPEHFEAAASFSGALDLETSTAAFPPLDEPLDSAREMAEGMGWNESNPVNVVEDLDGVELYISYGNGEPGKLDDDDRGVDPIETWIGQSNESFVAAMAEAGVDATINAYGEGTHSWPYWDRELGAALPLLLEALGVE